MALSTHFTAEATNTHWKGCKRNVCNIINYQCTYGMCTCIILYMNDNKHIRVVLYYADIHMFIASDVQNMHMLHCILHTYTHTLTDACRNACI